MDQWQLVVAGGAIGILAGPVTEWAKNYFDRKRGREERAQNFQQETLLALANHLTDTETAALRARLDLMQQGFPKSWGANAKVAAFEENFIAARYYRRFVDDDQIRELSAIALDLAGQSLQATNETDSTAQGQKATEAFNRAGDRIGEIVRSL